MITCQFVVFKDDLDKLKRAIDSISSLNPEIILLIDNSLNKHLDHFNYPDCKIFNFEKVKDFSMVRNKVIKKSKYDWQLFLEPWEIVTDSEKIKESMNNDPCAYNVPVLKNNVINYDVKFWHKSLDIKFINPVYEYLDIDDSKTKVFNSIIYSDGVRDISYQILEDWYQNNPSNVDVVYYKALYFLINKKWDDFINYANKFIFNPQSKRKALLNIKYYLAIVASHVHRNATESLRHILSCIATKPLTAEYWCVLGDIYYHLIGDYSKAERFYKNAIILGEFREEYDGFPIELNKYESYPQKMINSCLDLKKECNIFVNFSKQKS